MRFPGPERPRSRSFWEVFQDLQVTTDKSCMVETVYVTSLLYVCSHWMEISNLGQSSQRPSTSRSGPGGRFREVISGGCEMHRVPCVLASWPDFHGWKGRISSCPLLPLVAAAGPVASPTLVAGHSVFVAAASPEHGCCSWKCTYLM